MMSTGWDPEAPSLLRTIVCYADILGFRDLTRSAFESEEETEFLGRIKRSIDTAYGIVRTAATLDDELSLPTFDIKVFSDNIVVAYPLLAPMRDRGEPELVHLLMLFAEVQASLAAEGLFLRGAIAEGQHYQDRNIVYGDAFLEAVDLDRSGKPPRLVIAPSVESLILEHLSWYGGGWAPHVELLLEDPSDERLFLNYLETAFQHFPDGPIHYQLLADHSEKVRSRLRTYESDTYIRQKYEWIALYHNYVCRTFANRYLVHDFEGVAPEYGAASEEAQRVLEYLVPCGGLPSEHTPRPLDAQRLQQRLDSI